MPAKGIGIMELGRLGKISKVVESNSEASTEHGPKGLVHGVWEFHHFLGKRRGRKQGDGPSLAGGFGEERPSWGLERKSRVGFGKERQCRDVVIKLGFRKTWPSQALGRKG